MGQELKLAPGVEARKLAQRVLDLLAVPELAGSTELVKIAASCDSFDRMARGRGRCKA